MNKAITISRTFDDVKSVLHRLNMESLAGVNDIVTIDDRKGVIITLDDRHGKMSEVSRRIKVGMLELSDQFEYTLIVGKNQKKIAYPSLLDRIGAFSLQTLYRDVFWRATVIMAVYLFCLILALLNLELNEPALRELGNMVFTVSALITAFLITFLISKILSIRQEKLARAPRIRLLSNKLTKFRRVCYQLLNTWNFWQPSKKFADHGKLVAKELDYGDVYYLDIHDNPRYNYITDLMDYNQYGYIIQKWVLQLETFCKTPNRYVHNHVFLGSYAADYIYSGKELRNWAFFSESNLFWYVLEHERQDYMNSFDFNIPKPTIETIMATATQMENRFRGMQFDREFLVSLSQVAENEVLPELAALIKKNEAPLPFALSYLLICLLLVFLFGVLLQLNLRMFSNSLVVDLISIATVSAIVIHISLCMPAILKEEILMNRKKDYQ